MKRRHTVRLSEWVRAALLFFRLEVARAQSYEYDVDGRLVKVTYDDDATIRCRYDPNGDLGCDLYDQC